MLNQTLWLELVEKLEIPWSKPCLGPEEKEAVDRVMDSGWVSMGKETEAFERELAAYIGCRHVVCFNSGTSALIGALIALGAREVTLPSYSFIATLSAARTLGLGLIGSTGSFLDIDRYTLQMDVGCMSLEHFDSEGNVFLPVSLTGIPLKLDYCFEYSLVLEDGCQSLGAEAKDGKTGNQGWPVCFSFSTAKIITCIEGGAVATNSDELDHKLRVVRYHGEDPLQKDSFVGVGLNLRPTDISSVIGRVQLRRIDEFLVGREEIVRYYRESLRGFVSGFQSVPSHVVRHANMMFPIFVEDPIILAARLRERGIYARLGFKPFVDLPRAIWVQKHVLNLPLYNGMTLSEAEYVVEGVKECLSG